MNIKKSILWRVYLSFAFVCIFALAIVGQILRIQTVKGHYWKQLSDSLTTYYENIQPMRGNIYAVDGSLLATSIPIYDVHMDVSPKTIDKVVWKESLDSLVYCLNSFYHKINPKRYSDKTEANIREDLVAARRNMSRYFLIARNLSHTLLKELRTFPILRYGQYKGGLIVDQQTKRMMPFFPAAQRTIGYHNETVKPVGLEGAFNRYLSGKTGKRLIQKVSGGVWIPINDQNEVDPEDGKDIVTNIDVNFQDVAENALLKALQQHDANHGCAVVMDVKTGAIRAIANLSRTEDKDGDVEYREEYNSALGEATEPGSTFKLVSAMAMLDFGGMNPNTSVDTKNGETKFFDRTMRDAHDGGYGVLSLKKAFALSSNVGISTLAYQAFGKNPKKFTDYIAKLKLTRPLGLPISGEGNPYFKSPNSVDWNGTTIPWMSIGYEEKITPLQILTLYNSIANNGVMVKPQFVKEIKEVGKVIRGFNTEVINPEVCTPKTLKQIQQMLEAVVEEGTATNIKNDEYKIAGKTGTAQVANENGSYEEQNIYQASFVGYFPAEKPMYSIIVVINNPSKGLYYAASVAAPVFKEIADKIYAMTASTRTYAPMFEKRDYKAAPFAGVMNSSDLRNLIPYTDVENISVETDGWLKVNPKEKQVELKDYAYNRKLVPDVRGMVLSDAIYILENCGLKVKFKGRGKVSEQSIDARSKCNPNETIEITLE